MTSTAVDPVTTTRVEEAEPAALVVTRDFAAPPEKVWRAFTDPAILTRWMTGYPGWTMTCEMDVREGGAFRWTWEETETGSRFGFHGTYREVIPHGRIVNTETYDPGTVGGGIGTSVNTTTFAATPYGTRMVLRIDYDSPATRAAALETGMTEGMEVTYGLLDGVLAGG
ncbi:SRPBCC domain-containing protein [Wenxinia saemankumensis]|uniref:Uncharacterized conserved protein YndB, AHSA1/START domain n=1 Tax=Wenxinia saemankumensis TaxID=1447782 RepID=A0A1M6CPW5_9RHOB|nr:SRPBCC domain-containing protein [Wenxinia saemankumensis]SHI62923.1 Uncharacterized conserved protein YndB, AHSA1/START domain [Wenxinia saemankumensis]